MLIFCAFESAHKLKDSYQTNRQKKNLSSSNCILAPFAENYINTVHNANNLNLSGKRKKVWSRVTPQSKVTQIDRMQLPERSQRIIYGTGHYIVG